jgi:hypothetical protein
MWSRHEIQPIVSVNTDYLVESAHREKSRKDSNIPRRPRFCVYVELRITLRAAPRMKPNPVLDSGR